MLRLLQRLVQKYRKKNKKKYFSLPNFLSQEVERKVFKEKVPPLYSDSSSSRRND